MQISLIEMPAERVFKVNVDGFTIPGYINVEEGDEISWMWKDGNVSEVGFLTANTAALALVTRHIDNATLAAKEQREKAIKAAERRAKTPLDEGIKYWRCEHCNRTLARPYSKPPISCSCSNAQWVEYDPSPNAAPTTEEAS